MHQATDVIRVIAYAELALNHLGDACGGPQIGAIALCQRALEQQANKLLSLSGGQLQWASRRKTDLQSLVSALPSSIAPAHHRTRVTSDLPSDFVERVALIQQRQGATATVFQKLGTCLQSGHGETVPLKVLLHYLCSSQ